MCAFFQDYNPKLKKERELAIFNSENEQLGKHLTKTDECSSDGSLELFFSNENIDLINKQIILTIYKKTNYKINFQSKHKLIIVMQYIFNEYAKHLPYDIKGQIYELNCKVVKNVTGDIITNFEQKIVYLRDIEKRNDPVPLPISSTCDRTLQVKPQW
jgi:hypothetical protein